jgi:undecaprenyl-diphosphatase
MVLVPILGEALLDTIEMLNTGITMDGNTINLILGFFAAFISGCFACKFMINMVRKGKLIYFAIYCLIAGALALLLS